MMNRLADGNVERAFALAALTLTAKGVPFVYYGEEIGMQNITANTFQEMVDVQGKTHYKLALENGQSTTDALLEANQHNRDKSRSPMQWNSKLNAGFSTEKTWIKINPDYKKRNVEALTPQKKSILNKYKKLIELRNNEEVLQYGKYETLEFNDDQITFVRSLKEDRITVIINFGLTRNLVLPINTEILMGSKNLKANSFVIYKTNN
ncbi:Oligo-1,6-glucosidase [compost metagenome]